MKTLLTTSPTEAARIIRNGGIAAFPTETVYGLGADVFNASAIAKLFEAKRRPADNPLIAHIGDLEQIVLLASVITENAKRLIDAFFPGPLTVVIDKRDEVPMIATAGLDSIGIRMPQNELAREFLQACGTPVVAPSANLSGRPSPTTWQAVYEDLNGRIDCILQGAATEIGLESTVVDCRSEHPIVLRLGATSLEELRAVVAPTTVAESDDEGEIRSPGLKHKHYSPKALVRIVDLADEDLDARGGFIGLRRRDLEFARSKIVESPEEYAHELYEFFRECDRLGIATIYCERVDEIGIGAALMDRIRRATER